MGLGFSVLGLGFGASGMYMYIYVQICTYVCVYLYMQTYINIYIQILGPNPLLGYLTVILKELYTEGLVRIGFRDEGQAKEGLGFGLQGLGA